MAFQIAMTDTIIANKTLVISGLSIITTSVLIYYLVRRRRQYQKVAKISKLLIYPVKSMNGVEVNSLTINKVSSHGKYKDR